MRGGNQLFDCLNWSLGPGEALLLRGPNGSGKSSLLRVIAGFLRPTKGQITWENQEVHKSYGYRLMVHYIGHLNPVKPVLTVLENVKFWSDLNGGQEVAAAMDSFGLWDIADIPGRLLSSGQRRRVALANLIAVPRKVWLLDEASAGLDTKSARALLSAAEEHRAAGGLLVAVTHGELDVVNATNIALGAKE